MRKEALTVLFVTHDLTLAARYASHVGLFQAGRIHVGESSAILNPKDLDETYGVPVSVYEEPTGALCVRMERKG